MASGHRPRTGMTDINVTPLVDVALVLLVIFMITAPMIDQQKGEDDKRMVEVDLPRTDAEEVDLAEEQKLILVIDDKLRIFIGEVMLADCGGEADRRLCMNELEEKLGKNEKLRRDREVYLMADREIPYGIVVDAMARLRKSGVDTLGMVTDPPEEEPPAGGGSRGTATKGR